MENQAAATALNYFAYNFIKIHRTLRTSPAMAAGVTDRTANRRFSSASHGINIGAKINTAIAR
jgi:hypothetical protein